jgi:hypothetical protein
MGYVLREHCQQRRYALLLPLVDELGRQRLPLVMLFLMTLVSSRYKEHGEWRHVLYPQCA